MREVLGNDRRGGARVLRRRQEALASSTRPSSSSLSLTLDALGDRAWKAPARSCSYLRHSGAARRRPATLTHPPGRATVFCCARAGSRCNGRGSPTLRCPPTARGSSCPAPPARGSKSGTPARLGLTRGAPKGVVVGCFRGVPAIARAGTMASPMRRGTGVVGPLREGVGSKPQPPSQLDLGGASRRRAALSRSEARGKERGDIDSHATGAVIVEL